MMKKTYGEYLEKGDYHKMIDKNWRYYPVYVEKIRLIENFLEKSGKGKKIVDLGCGEGVNVEKFKNKGCDIIGIDLNYESDSVLKRSITETSFADDSFDVALCLDVLEHISFEDQEKALDEINRIVKPGGTVVFSLPNMAHLASRFSFFFLGKPIRTAEIKRHKGERTIAEYLKLIKGKKFDVVKRKGLFPTYPVSSIMTYYFPSKMVLWHRILSRFFGYPNWSAINLIICKNKK